MEFFGLKKTITPPTVPTDTIIPFHYYDDTHHNRGLAFDFTFRFDDVLDPRKLQMAFSRLLELGDWRKLGARIRRNGEGKLEYHVPESFDDKRPGFAYSTATFDCKVDDHTQASRLAQPHNLDAEGHPSLLGLSYAATPEFRSFIRVAGFPNYLNDWLHSDSPQIGIRVIIFQDATLVTISFLHSLMDMMGLNTVLDAWITVLCGQEDQVKPFIGFSHDPLAGLKDTKPKLLPKYVFAETLLMGWAWILFALRYILLVEMFWKYREEERMIFLPRKYMHRMRKEAMEELAPQTTSDGKPFFVSDGDVLYAWWTRVVLRAENPSPGRMVNMRSTYCCRSLLADLGHIPSATSALVTNAVSSTLTFLSVRQILERPLSFTASAIREALLQQRNEEQFQAYDAIKKDTLDNANHPALFGSPNMYMIMMSNWAKAKLFEVNFSAAVRDTGMPLDQRKNQSGKPSFILGTGTKSYATKNTGVVIGKDAVGNYWLLYTLHKDVWPAVQQQLLSLLD